MARSGVALLLACAWPGVCAAPYRGWSSWSLSAIRGSAVYGPNWLSAANVVAQSDALAASPLQRAWGPAPPYINVDSFWASDPTQIVDQFGRNAYDPSRFPNGIAPVASHVHANGQRFGIYLNPGVPVAAVKRNSSIEGHPECTVADIAWQPLRPGNTFGDTYAINHTHPCAQFFIDSWARQLAGWGVDFLKMDAVSPGSGVSDMSIDNRADVAAWSTAITNSGANIWLTISWHINASFAADFAPYTNAWRTSDDVECYCETLAHWSSVATRFTEVLPWLRYVAEGKYPDLDSLDVAQGPLDGLSNDEKLTAATLWAITGAPIYTGNDLTQGDEYGLLLLTNPAMLAINEVGMAAVPVQGSAGSQLQVWRLDFANGTSVVALFNLGSATANVTADVDSSSGGGGMQLADVWLSIDLGIVRNNFTVPLRSHACGLFMLSPA